MKTIFQTLLTCLLTLGLSFQVTAAHFSGCEISYKCTSTPGIFETTLVIYKQCGPGGALCGGGCGGVCTQSLNILGADPGYLGVSYGFVQLQLQNVRDVDVKKTCPGVKSICNNMGCVSPGSYSPAYERYEFKGMVNLGSTSSIPAACCNVSLAFALCCRTSDIQTGAADASFYNEAVINRCHSISPCNSSPELKTDPDIMITGGENYIGNWGAVDPDHDSLTYSFAPALVGQGASVTYTPPFSYNKPMPWMGNWDGIFPQGIRCDPLNGDIQFTPPNSGSFFKGVICVAVKQWRTINGVPTVIGITRRDMEVYIVNAPPNNPPRLVTNPPEDGNVNVPKVNQYVCEGEQLCFTITAKDTDFNPPLVADTTYLSWDNALANLGATFVPDYDITKRNKPDSLGGGPREDRYKFCWTPPAGSASSNPYYFTVSAGDKRCPTPGELTRAFGITVLQRPSAQIHQSTNSCSQQLVRYSNTTPTIPIISATWRIAKVPGDSTFANGFNTYPATTTPGIFIFKSTGIYAIQLEVNSKGPIGNGGCPTIYPAFIDVTTLALDDSLQVTHPTCALIPSGKIIVKALNGTAPYQYKLDNQPYTSNDTFTNLLPGKHIITIKDFMNCEKTDSVWLNNPTVVSSTIQYTLPLCHNGTDGTLSIHAKGGKAPYTYSINQQPAQTDSTFTNLQPGKYQILIKDSNACIKVDTFIMENTPELNIQYTKVKPLCYSGNDGKIIVSAKSGKAPFSYSINQQAFQPDSVFQNLAAGKYQIRVRDANSCTKTDSVRVEDPVPATTLFAFTPVSCFGKSDGKIQITMGGGKAPFTYRLNQLPAQSSPVFEHLNAGMYLITITDSNQCQYTKNVEVQQPQPLTYVKNKKPITCYNTNDGSLSMLPNGGTAPYHVEWNGLNYFMPATIQHITHGIYHYRLLDAKGCFVELTDTFNNPDQIIAGHISGDSVAILASTHTYSVPFQPNLNFVWTVTGGTLVSSSPNPPSAVIQWNTAGTGLITLTAFDGACGDTTTMEVQVGSTGVNELAQALGVTLYPNPTHNILNVSVKLLPDNTNIQLYDIQGKLLMEQELKLQQQLNIESLTPGIYLLKIGAWKGQVIKE